MGRKLRAARRYTQPALHAGGIFLHPGLGYAGDALSFRSAYRGGRKNNYGKGTSFTRAVGYSAPALGASLATRGMKSRYALPITIAAGIGGEIATNKAIHRYGRQAKTRSFKRARRIRKAKRKLGGRYGAAFG